MAAVGSRSPDRGSLHRSLPDQCVSGPEQPPQSALQEFLTSRRARITPDQTGLRGNRHLPHAAGSHVQLPAGTRALSRRLDRRARRKRLRRTTPLTGNGSWPSIRRPRRVSEWTTAALRSGRRSTRGAPMAAIAGGREAAQSANASCHGEPKRRDASGDCLSPSRSAHYPTGDGVRLLDKAEALLAYGKARSGEGAKQLMNRRAMVRRLDSISDRRLPVQLRHRSKAHGRWLYDQCTRRPPTAPTTTADTRTGSKCGRPIEANSTTAPGTAPDLVRRVRNSAHGLLEALDSKRARSGRDPLGSVPTRVRRSGLLHSRRPSRRRQATLRGSWKEPGVTDCFLEPRL